MIKPTAQSVLAILIVSLVTPTLRAADGEGANADRALLSGEARDYALGGPELLKVNRRSKDLMAADLNGDGRTDLAVVTNERSLLEVFHRREKIEEGGPEYERTPYTLDRIVRQATTMDVNGDGRTDVVIAASPAKLVIMYQDDQGRLQPPDETELRADRVVVGELTGDNRGDLLVYSDKRFDILAGDKRGLGLEPVQTFYTTGDPASSPMIIDFDGDGLNDIVYHDASRFEQLVIRLQSPEKTFPSEFRRGTTTLRNVVPQPAKKGERASVVAVLNNTRGLAQLALAPANKPKDADRLELSSIVTIPFDPDLRSGQVTTTIADVDGDGRLDVVASSPDLSRMMLLTQTRSGALTMESYPGFQGLQSVMPLSTDARSATPLVLFSPTEKAIGFAKYDTENATLPFPRILPVEGEPLGAAVATIDGKTNLLAVIGGKDSDKQLVAYTLSAAGELGARRVVYTPAEGAGNPLADLDVVGLEAMDLNRDDLDDLIVYGDFKSASPMIQQKDGNFLPLDATSGVLGGLLSGAKPNNLDRARIGDAKAPSSAVAIKDKFARAFHIDGDGNVVVERQFDGQGTGSRLTSLAVGNLHGDARTEVVLLDRGNRELLVYGQKTGDYEVLARLPIGEGEFTSVSAVDLDGDDRAEILLSAQDRLGIVYTHPLFGELETLATGGPADEKDGGFGKVYTLQLLDSGPLEALAVEMKDNLLEFFELGENENDAETFLRFYRFRMFDSETTIARRVNMDALPEPREALATDLDEDGHPELVTLTHDNIIVYKPVGMKGDKKTAKEK